MAQCRDAGLAEEPNSAHAATLKAIKKLPAEHRKVLDDFVRLLEQSIAKKKR